VFSTRSVPRCSKQGTSLEVSLNPCGGGIEYFHRDPASSRRRRKGKSQIWDSKIWSRLPRDSDPRKTALARASSIYKRQTRRIVREGAPQKQDRNCQIREVIAKYLVMSPRRGRHQDLLTDRPSVAMWLWLWGEGIIEFLEMVVRDSWQLQRRIRLRVPELTVGSCQLREWQELCTGGYDKGTWAQEAEESPQLEVVARERLVKTPGWKRLSGCCSEL
jgi:hypothetical protein